MVDVHIPETDLKKVTSQLDFEEQRDFAIVLLFSTCDRLFIKLLDGCCALSYEINESKRYNCTASLLTITSSDSISALFHWQQRFIL